jgi:hypothetical protein
MLSEIPRSDPLIRTNAKLNALTGNIYTHYRQERDKPFFCQHSPARMLPAMDFLTCTGANFSFTKNIRIMTAIAAGTSER